MARRSRKIKRSRSRKVRRVSQKRKSRKVKKSRRSRKVRRTRRKRMRGGAEAANFNWITRKNYADGDPEDRLKRIEQLENMTDDQILVEIQDSKAKGEFDAMLQEYLSGTLHVLNSIYPDFPIKQSAQQRARLALFATIDRVGESQFMKMNNGKKEDAILISFNEVGLPHTAFKLIKNHPYLT